MASKEQFLSQLDELLAGLKNSVAENRAAQASNMQTLAELKRQRASRLADVTRSLLPSLAPASIARLEREVPGVVSAVDVQRLLAETRAAFQAQLVHLTVTYDPSRHEATRVDLTHRLDTALADVQEVQSSFERLSTDTVRRLITNDYGTPGYSYGWFDRQFYRDWREADEVVEKAGLQEWSEFLELYNTQKQALEELQSRVTSLRGALSKLEEDKARFKELSELLQRVPDVVLEKLHVKLQGHLDGMHPAPVWMRDVEPLSAKMVALEEETQKLRELHIKLSEQLTCLADLQGRALRSSQRHVPEEYLTQLQGRRPLSGTGSSYTEVHVHHDSFLDSLAWGQMSDYFGREAAYERGRRDEARSHHSHGSYSSYRSDTYQSAWSDRSGQS